MALQQHSHFQDQAGGYFLSYQKLSPFKLPYNSFSVVVIGQSFSTRSIGASNRILMALPLPTACLCLGIDAHHPGIGAPLGSARLWGWQLKGQGLVDPMFRIFSLSTRSQVR
jgi:hypothetical protein